VTALEVSWLFIAALACASSFVYLNRLGVVVPVWRSAVLERAQPEIGFNYIAQTGRPLLSSHEHPSSAIVLENGMPLPGPGNALHDDIRKIGRGRYSFWHGSVYFATSDNTDPRTNGRLYQIRYPLMVGGIAYPLYVLTLLGFIAAVLSTRLVMRERGKTFDSIITAGVVWAIVLMIALSILSIAFAVAGSMSQLLTNRLWLVVGLLNLLAAWVLRKKFGHSTPKRYLLPLFFAVLICFYLFAVKIPHTPQECTADVAYSDWDAFCTAPDSYSYYQGYSVGSTRQPLYSWFINLVTIGSGFSPVEWARQHPVRVAIADPRDPLHRVVRAQMVFLLGAALIACSVMVILLNSPLPCFLFVMLYYFRFLIPTEFNMVLTESLVQAWLFLLVGVFLAFIWKKQKLLLPVAGALCGALYLTRQASGYTLICLAAMIIWGMSLNWRIYWRACAAAVLVFAVLAAIPDIYGYFTLGHLASAQNSLQYQYRIAYAIQFAQPQDARLMPDEDSRLWLANMFKVRETSDNKVREVCKGDPYCEQVYYIDLNLYEVATPPGFNRPNLPEFFMKIATPILKNHYGDYLLFGFRSWTLALAQPGISRIRFRSVSPWFVYALCLVGIVLLRGRAGFAAAILIMGHFSHVALACLFAAPIPRMVQASEFLVVIAVFLLLWKAFERINAGVTRMVRAD
jgi:MFS family permease